MGPLPLKNYPKFSKNGESYIIKSVARKGQNPLNQTSDGLKYPPEVRVQHETCSTICGTPVQAILDQKNLTGLAGGVREGPNIAKYGPRFWLRSPLEAPKWVKDPWNGLKSIRGGWGDRSGPFPGSWTHLGASRGLRSQKWGPYLAIFGPSLTPPANLVKFFWSKMACTGVPHIVLHVSCGTRTSGGYFWPSEVRFRGILALSRDWFYNGHIENLG